MSISFTSLFFVLIILFVFAIYSAESQVVHIKQGILKGFVDTSRDGRKYTSFEGIPFAKPPVAELRLRSPQPHPGWSGERNATVPGNICPQFTDRIVGHEDCLFLNVYTPQMSSSAKLPVMFWIHGGAMKWSSGSEHKAKFFMDKDVVLVTANYRLGILGFMSFADEIIPGNFGIQDQLLALKWVNENIEQFGGNPKLITIFGGSSGSASVDLHVVSPLSKGLFQKAILQSGSASCPWAVVPQDIARQRGQAASTLMGCSSKTTSEALECLQDVPFESFVTTLDMFHEWNDNPVMTFAAVQDGFLKNESLLPDHPLNLRPNPVSTIIGMASREGNFVAGPICINNLKAARELEADLPRRLTILMNIQDQVEYKNWNRVTQELMKFYMKGENISVDNVGENIQEMATHIIIGHGVYKTALHYYKHIPVYFYLFDIASSSSYLELYNNCPATLRGPTHGDDNYFLFNDLLTFSKHEYTREDCDLSRQIIDTWTNFALSGSPNENWTRMKSDRIEYFYMSKEKEFHMRRGLFENGLKFIESLPLVVNQYNGKSQQKTEL